ncbi:MAG: hypothetical protein LBD95_07470, partial [Clostridiales Family XIII bacterium]|nr:hypothetical protein [Clostridiales Family XIII bacterium]
DDPVRIEIGADGKSISARVGTLWDTQTAAMWAAGNLIPEELQMAEEGVFYYKASVKFPVLIDDEAIGANTWTKSNNSAYFDFDTGRSPDYISPDIIFTSGGGGGVTPPPVETPEEDGEEEEQGPPPGEEDEDTQTVPPQPGTPVQPGTPDVPPVPYSPGGTLVPLDDGGFLEIDENGVPLGVWNYDEDEGAWIFDEEVPLALLPQTGAGLPAAGFAWLWVLPLLVLLWLLFVRPWLRRRIGSRARDGIL